MVAAQHHRVSFMRRVRQRTRNNLYINNIVHWISDIVCFDMWTKNGIDQCHYACHPATSMHALQHRSYSELQMLLICNAKALQNVGQSRFKCIITDYKSLI